MKIQEVQKLFLAGSLVVLGEFRMAAVDGIDYRDKKTGNARHADVIKTTLEIGNKTLTLTEFVREENFKPENWKCPFKKGQRVVVELDGLMENKGILTGSGTLHPLED